METTLSLWSYCLISREDCPQLANQGEKTAEVRSMASHIVSGRKIMIFRGNLTRNFYPASLG
jgi:hypothetical protein